MEPQTQIQRTKLHTIYNALDTNNYNRAIKLCTQHKVISSLDITISLKAHAYERIYKKKESLLLIQQLIQPFYKNLEEYRFNCYDLFLALEEFSNDDDSGNTGGGSKKKEEGVDLIDIFDDNRDDILKKDENVTKVQKERVITDEVSI